MAQKMAVLIYTSILICYGLKSVKDRINKWRSLSKMSVYSLTLPVYSLFEIETK